MAQNPAFAPQSLVGTTIDGRYRLTGHIASGGMGAVFRAEHVYMRKDVAVKVLRPDLTAASDIVERFRREAEIAASLEHDNIVRVTDFGRSPDGFLFLVMELLKGESLFDRARRLGPLPAEEVVPILAQVCAGLDAAHRRGVVHRDLKPENVFLHRVAGGGTVAKILDFGIAKITDPTSASATHPGMVVGTPEYLSPEQAIGSSVDSRADIYAVGLIAWRVLAGRHPFRADDPRALLMMQATQPVPPVTEPRPDLASLPGLVAAVARACAKAPGERHRTAADFGRELVASLGGERPLPSLRLVTGTLTPVEAESPTPPIRPDPRQALSIGFARARVLLRAALPMAWFAARRTPRRLQIAWYRPRERRLLVAAVAFLLAAAAAAGTLAWRRQQPLIRAKALMAAGRPRAARPLLEVAVAGRPDDPELRTLLGRALHQLPDQAPAAVDAYEAAAALDVTALVPAALPDLVADLGLERRVADRAARLLARVGPAALPAVLAAAQKGPGFARLRALGVARDLGGEDRLDRAAVYGSLLGDHDCEVRKAAARRLGELGSVAALPDLRKAAQSKVETSGFLGIKSASPACGAAEAVAAIRRIEASAPRPSSR